MNRQDSDSNRNAVDTDSPAPVAAALRGVDFPQDKNGLKQYAEENGASQDVLNTIENMPDQEYQTMADVFSGVGESDRQED